MQANVPSPVQFTNTVAVSMNVGSHARFFDKPFQTGEMQVSQCIAIDGIHSVPNISYVLFALAPENSQMNPASLRMFVKAKQVFTWLTAWTEDDLGGPCNK